MWRTIVVAVLATSACAPKSALERCVEEKTAEYYRLYPDTKASDREDIRTGQRIFCKASGISENAT